MQEGALEGGVRYTVYSADEQDILEGHAAQAAGPVFLPDQPIAIIMLLGDGDPETAADVFDSTLLSQELAYGRWDQKPPEVMIAWSSHAHLENRNGDWAIVTLPPGGEAGAYYLSGFEDVVIFHGPERPSRTQIMELLQQLPPSMHIAPAELDRDPASD